MFNRENGQPINPIVETPVRTESDVPGEQIWPTQPYPYTAKGVPMTPFCATFPIVPDPEKAKRARPMFWPPSMKEFPIMADGGSNYGSPAFSPRTNLLYVTGRNSAMSFTIKIAGDTLRPSPTPDGDFKHGCPARSGSRRAPHANRQRLQSGDRRSRRGSTSSPGTTNGGNLVTAGDLVFQGSETGEFFALDARSGKELFKTNVRRGIRASPMTYRANGRQYVAVRCVEHDSRVRPEVDRATPACSRDTSRDQHQPLAEAVLESRHFLTT